MHNQILRVVFVMLFFSSCCSGMSHKNLYPKIWGWSRRTLLCSIATWWKRSCLSFFYPTGNLTLSNCSPITQHYTDVLSQSCIIHSPVNSLQIVVRNLSQNHKLRLYWKLLTTTESKKDQIKVSVLLNYWKYSQKSLNLESVTMFKKRDNFR